MSDADQLIFLLITLNANKISQLKEITLVRLAFEPRKRKVYDSAPCISCDRKLQAILVVHQDEINPPISHNIINSITFHIA